jgi:hypothetical protein
MRRALDLEMLMRWPEAWAKVVREESMACSVSAERSFKKILLSSAWWVETYRMPLTVTPRVGMERRREVRA